MNQIRAGDWVAARDEANPDGPVEWKLAEAKFSAPAASWNCSPMARKSARRQSIRSTSRKKAGRKPGAHAGDEVRTRDGWATIDEVRDTGLYEKVYNIRVADFHTYFVGGMGVRFGHIMRCARISRSAYRAI